jgi:hypothetical protein
MTEIDALPAYEYHLGQHPLDVAISIAEVQIHVRDVVVSGRTTEPESFPAYGNSEARTIASRLIGELIGAGWKPPTDEEVKAAAATYADTPKLRLIRRDDEL